MPKSNDNEFKSDFINHFSAKLLEEKDTKGIIIPIWVRVTVDGRFTEFSESKQVLHEHRDANRSEENHDCPDARSIYDYLENVRVKVKKLYNTLLTIKDHVTAEM